MKTHRWQDIKHKLSPARRAQLEREAAAEAAAITLRELRAAAGKTQEELAELTAMTQSELSRVERREDHKLSTLRRYVEALGGELEVVAVLGGKRVVLAGV